MAYRYYDQRIKRIDKLSKPMQEEILLDLINAFSQVKSVEDSALFIQDLLTENEVKILSKRLRIAKLLLKGKKYEDIIEEVRAARATIAKVAVWLSESGEGFKKVVRRLPEPEKIKEWWEKADWERLMERYPRYFWPLTLDEGSKKGRIQQRKDLIRKTMGGLGEKERTRRRVQKMADEYYKDQQKERKGKKRKGSNSSAI
jgi:TrpR-related protein YerC/YecD